jgi:gas vesicle protein
MSDRNSGESMLAFMLGGLLGACLGILYAPQPGKQTRKKLKVLLEDLGEKAEDLLEEGKDKVEEIVANPKDKTTPKKKEQ